MTAGTSAWILAGGESRRFGSDKAMALVGGETLLARTARICAECGLKSSVVARAPRDCGLPTVIETTRAERHPLYGVATALAAAAGRGERTALLLPCDLSDLPASAVLAVLSTPAPACADGQPLLCHLPVGLAASARAAAASGAPVRAFLRAAGATGVAVGELHNMNRPMRGSAPPRDQ